MICERFDGLGDSDEDFSFQSCNVFSVLSIFKYNPNKANDKNLFKLLLIIKLLLNFIKFKLFKFITP